MPAKRGGSSGYSRTPSVKEPSTKLTGTPKQVAYANDIRADMAKTLTEHYKGRFERAKSSKRIRTEEVRQQRLATIRNDASEASAALSGITNSKWFINRSRDRNNAEHIIFELRLTTGKKLSTRGLGLR